MQKIGGQGHCRICNRAGNVENHHIISRHRCWVIGRLDLLDAPGNLVDLCVECHGHTSASLIRNILIEQEANESSHTMSNVEYSRTFGKPKSEKLCKDVCVTHKRRKGGTKNLEDEVKLAVNRARENEVSHLTRSRQKGPTNKPIKIRRPKKKNIGWRVHCFRCGRLTHLASDCSQSKDIEGKLIPSSARKNHWLVKRRGTSCFRCGLAGHRWDKCTSNRHIDGRPLVVSTE
jgi:hypothetical protein